MTVYIDFLKILIEKEYHSGLKVVPIILMANLLYGIYFAQSLWYKVTDKTRYGAYQSLIGAAVAVTLNILLIPVYGYMGSAVALLVSFGVILLISYFTGQKHYPVPYDLKRIATYFTIALTLYFISGFFSSFHTVIKYSINTIFLLIFLASVFMFENRELKGLFKFNKKK
jgi:O-antigen/teichoic acid export membrane protein